MSNKTHKIRMAGAQTFACENFNVARADFIELAAKRYPLVEVDTEYFISAVRYFDEIQKEMKEIA